ncbi:hypothetical protein ACFU5O_20980 [Streptomyces sp. NPDC057445]|uniref:hypothetical protein n=1 Tax=Streptomyces sp. NPDC057445 TaxID=3346136 RepID=UPI0036A62FA7
MPIEYRALPTQVVEVDVEKHISIHTMDDVESRRAHIIRYLWKGRGLPATMPAVEQGVGMPAELAGLTGVSLVTRLSVPMRYGVGATMYLVHPRTPPIRRLGIHHTGHGEDPVVRLPPVQALLDVGYIVLCCDMPFVGWNTQRIQTVGDPSTYLDLGRGVAAHNRLAAYESPTFTPLTYWLEPLAVAVNYVQATLRPRSISMVGLSGGGWTTTAYSAIDPRITRSYPTAGSLPAFLHTASLGSQGDYEQEALTAPGFYAHAGLLDLYAMGAIGPRRGGQLQILNRFDRCCFWSVSHRSYAPVVSHRVALAGEGHWDVLEDATHDKHQISPYALDVILWDQEHNPPD